jgi:hypothetical protein
MEETEEHIEDNASSVSYENEKKGNIVNIMEQQLLLRQFFKLIIYLEDNETEENKI